MTTAARRELAAAVGGAVAAGALALIAGGQTWAETTVERQPPLPPVVEVLSGSDAAPLVPAAGVRALTGGLEAVEGTAEISAAWPVLAVVAGVLGVAAGLLAVLRGRTWPGMGRRYERTPEQAAPARPVTDEDRAQAAWKALDRGEDPTA